MSRLKFTLTKVLFFAALPLALDGIMVGMYFSGNECLQSIIAPHSFNDMRPDSGREFGLLENMQHLLILMMVGACLWAVCRKPLRWEKIGFALLAIFAMFIFLEEIDYGLHYYEYFRGIEWYESADVRNLHNQGDVTDVMKRGVDLTLVGLFLVVAWACGRSRFAFVRYIAPDKWFTLTLMCMAAMRFLVHALGDRERELAGPFGQVGAISRGNLSEFREFFVYYVFAMYLITMVYLRDYRPARAASSGSVVER